MAAGAALTASNAATAHRWITFMEFSSCCGYVRAFTHGSPLCRASQRSLGSAVADPSCPHGSACDGHHPWHRCRACGFAVAHERRQETGSAGYGREEFGLDRQAAALRARGPVANDAYAVASPMQAHRSAAWRRRGSRAAWRSSARPSRTAWTGPRAPASPCPRPSACRHPWPSCRGWALLAPPRTASFRRRRSAGARRRGCGAEAKNAFHNDTMENEQASRR